jgi:hypothetical protein
MLTLPTTKTTTSRDPSRVPILIYGNPKVGKSTFAASIPGAIFMATEPGFPFLEIYKFPPEDDAIITTYAQFTEGMALLSHAKASHRGDDFPFNVVVIDTLDQLYRLICEYFCQKHGVDYINDLEYGKGFALANGELQRLLMKILNQGFGLVLVSHSQVVERKRNGNVQTTRTVPTLPEKARQVVVGLVSYVLYCDIEEEVSADGKLLTRRVLRTAPSTSYEAGCRSIRGCELPATIPLDWEAFKIETMKQLKEAPGGP